MNKFFSALLFFTTLFITPLSAEFTTQDTITFQRLFGEADQAHRQNNSELSYQKIDSLIKFGYTKQWGFCAIAIGLAYKATYADENHHLDIYYKVIKETRLRLPEFLDELGPYGVETQLNNDIRLGHYFKRRGSYNRAIDIFNEVHEKLKSDPTPRINTITTLLLQLGSTNKNIGNNQIALAYVLEARDSFLSGDASQFSEGYEGLLHKNIADIYAALGQIDSADYYYNYALNQYQNISLKQRNIRNRVITTYNGFAEFSLQQGNPDKAINLLNQSLNIHLDNDPFYEQTYRLMGQALAEKENFDQANSYFQQSIQANQYDLKNYQLAETYLAMGKVQEARKDYAKAIAFYQEALVNLKEDFNAIDDLCQNPKLEEVFSKRVLLQVLHQKAKTMANLSTEYLDCSIRTFRLAINLVDSISIDYSSDYEKQYLIKENYSLFEDAIHAGLMQDTEEGRTFAFQCSEKSKSILLLEAVRNTQIRDYAIPDSLVDQEQEFKFKLLTLQEQKYKASRQGQSTEDLDKSIIKVQRQLDSMYYVFQQEYQDYFQLRYGHEVDQANRIKERLSERDACIEYFVGEKNTYAFLLQKDKAIQVFSIPMETDDLFTLVQDFLHAIYIPYIEDRVELETLKSKYTLDHANTVFAANGFELYHLLVQPLINALDENIQHLEIIPDGILNYLPFDALIGKEITADKVGFYENSTDYQYLARQYQISYCYSATLMRMMEERKQENVAEAKLLVFDGFGFEAQINVIKNLFQDLGILKSFTRFLEQNMSQATSDRL